MEEVKQREELVWIIILELMVLLQLGFVNGFSQCPLVSPLVQIQGKRASRHLSLIAQSIPSRTQVPFSQNSKISLLPQSYSLLCLFGFK